MHDVLERNVGILAEQTGTEKAYEEALALLSHLLGQHMGQTGTRDAEKADAYRVQLGLNKAAQDMVNHGTSVLQGGIVTPDHFPMTEASVCFQF